MSRSKKSTTSEATAAWSHYWASGALHSCSMAFQGNYADELRDFWFGFFAGLPKGARILDIGTGNGALAFLALEFDEQNACRFEISGIDAAVIHPAVAARAYPLDATRITLRGAVNAENTGYPDAYFDAVTSQYAIEYSRMDETLVELARIVRPGGWAGFMMHHAESEALVATAAELRAFDFISHEAPVLVPCRRFLRRLSFAKDRKELTRKLGDPESRRLRLEIDRNLAALVEYAQQHPGAGFVHGLAQQVVRAMEHARGRGPAAGMESLEIIAEAMTAHELRLRAIRRAAQRRQDVADFVRLAQVAGFDPSPPAEIRRGGRDLLGWTVTATRGM